jgi:hypothetical protein
MSGDIFSFFLILGATAVGCISFTLLLIAAGKIDV